MRAKEPTADEAIARLASRKHGNVGRCDLLDLGLSSAAISRRIDKGSLVRRHHGVYAVGHSAPSVDATYMAAAMACGPKAALYRVAAAHLHRLIRGPAPAPQVAAPTRRRVPGIETHQVRSLDSRDITRVRGIPVTTVPRTLVDIAGVLSLDALALACHEAGVKHHVTPRQVEEVLGRVPNAAGAAKLRRILHGDTSVSLSALERRFISLISESNLPRPVTNKPAGGRRVDCRWPEHRVTVELDSYRYHGSRHAWERDRAREREAYARGDQFRRFTYGDVFEHPGRLLRELRGILS